jgi:hypothetical protein
MGMSPEEEQAIVDARPDVVDDEDNFIQEFDLLLSEMATMRPLHDVTLQPFLLAQRVLDVGQVRRYIGDFTDPLYGDSPEVPAHLSNEQAIAVLVGTGLRLPSEAELEGGARGHLRRSLLPTSTRIPDEDSIEAMLADEAEGTSNAFGLHGYGLYPERCADAWHEHYKGAPADGSAWSGPGPRVVRGGAANCYPWQACGEWNVMLCAFRMSDHAAEFGAAIRPARSICPNTTQRTRRAPRQRHPPRPPRRRPPRRPPPRRPTPRRPTPRRKTSTKTATKKTATKKATATKKPATKKPRHQEGNLLHEDRHQEARHQEGNLQEARRQEGNRQEDRHQESNLQESNLQEANPQADRHQAARRQKALSPPHDMSIRTCPKRHPSRTSL